MSMVSTAEGLVTAFGGPRATARWAGVSVPAVYQWLADDHVPRAHSLAVYLTAKRMGIAIDTVALFGVDGAGNYQFADSLETSETV